MTESLQTTTDHECSKTVSTPTRSQRVEIFSFKTIFIKASALALVFLMMMIVCTILVMGCFVYFRANQFLNQVPLNWSDVAHLFQSSQTHHIQHSDQVSNFLVLGTDTVANKPNAPVLTDSMLLVSLNARTGSINLLSLPRDLWIDAYQTRINALYYYGIEKYPDQPERFPSDVIAELTGIPIHYTLIISLETLGHMVDALGGVEVSVTTGFTDPKFPRDDVDLSQEQDPSKLYKTITFNEGIENMSGSRVLEYARSRNSEGDTGTDINRSERQQAIITALITKLSKPSVMLNPDTAAKMYLIYDQNLAQQISLLDVIIFLKQLFPIRDQIELRSHHLSIYPDHENGVIEHPPMVSTQGQWIYSIRDMELFKQEIYDKLAVKSM